MSFQTIYCHPGSLQEKQTVISNICPRCGVSVHFEEVAYYQWRDNDNYLQNSVLLLCPYCRHTVCVEFDDLGEPEIFPRKSHFALNPEIEKNYPRFSRIYKQALAAESLGLDELAGMGIRKSIEALTKQYAAELNPDDKEKIERETLKQAIDNIKIQNVRLLALANTYVANDFTHLVPKHPEYNLQDLKTFTEALQYFILMNRRIADAEILINPSK